jgi:hypothetical protein
MIPVAFIPDCFLNGFCRNCCAWLLQIDGYPKVIGQEWSLISSAIGDDHLLFQIEFLDGIFPMIAENQPVGRHRQ